MTVPRIMVVVSFLLILALPFVVRTRSGGAAAAGEHAATGAPSSVGTLVIVTPHVAQIREEFGAAFERWHARMHPNEPGVKIDWRVPGGTSEIVKQLRAEYEASVKAAARDARLIVQRWSDDRASCEATLPAGSMGADLMFGGGSYEHNQLRAGVAVRVRMDGKEVAALVRLSEPAGFEPARMTGGASSWFAANKIGNQELYEKDQYWIGVALSAFGIVYNRELIAERGLPEPKVFSDLTDFRYYRGLALTDPRQSGSVTTTYESILNKDGWDEGWRVLREMGANARSFASASTKPPVDVSQGDALAGLAIDFYGRAQAQAVLRKDEDPASGRVGYVDPRGEVYIDADPVSILRAGPNPRLARRFVEFCLSDEGQALWQLPPRSSSAGQSNPIGESGRRLGPERYSLRRLPSRHAIYEKHLEHFVDRVDPFELAAPLPDRRWRRSIDVMIGAFAVDTLDELRVAWEALNAARRDEAFPRDVLAKMERDFHAFPRGEDVKRLAASLFPGLRLPDDAVLDFSPETSGGVEDNCRRIVATWGDADLKARLRVIYTEFFREKYVGVAAMARARK